MVQSNAQTVDAYLTTIDPIRIDGLRRLRAMCLELLPGWQERMQWGMPGYGPPGSDAVVSFNSQKRHIAFYAGPTAVERFKDRLAGMDCGKGCVRYRRADEMDFEVIAAMLKDIRKRGGPMC
jgi:uncharacterized protein YdhG (YjbR/CyaY superfamily)